MVERLDRRALEEGKRSGLVPLPAEVDRRMSHLRRGWYWGRQEFAQRMLKLAKKSSERAPPLPMPAARKDWRMTSNKQNSG